MSLTVSVFASMNELLAVKLSLCLIRYHTMMTYLLINHHAMKLWRYSSTHS